MADPIITPLGINAQYLKDLSFESPNAPGLFASPPDAEPRLEVAVNVASQPMTQQGGQALFEVTLRIKAEAKFGDKVGFIVEVAYAGVVTLPTSINEARRKDLLIVEVPKLLFPYARAIISDQVRDGGFPPMLLQPIDFAAMAKESDGRSTRTA